MMKKLFSIILSVLLLFTLGSAVYAEDTVYSEGKLYYTITDDSVTIVGAFGSDETITVPAAIAGYPVNTIASGAFTSRTNLKTLNLPDTITSIEEGALPSGINVVYNSEASKQAGSGSTTGGGSESTGGTEDSGSESQTVESVTGGSNLLEYLINAYSTDSDGNPMPDTYEVTEDEDEEATSFWEKIFPSSSKDSKSQSSASSGSSSSGSQDNAETNSTATNPVVIIGGIVILAIALAAVIIIGKKKDTGEEEEQYEEATKESEEDDQNDQETEEVKED